MPNYKKMYLTMAKATEKAINSLIQAQRDAEEIYISENERGGKRFLRRKKKEKC